MATLVDEEGAWQAVAAHTESGLDEDVTESWGSHWTAHRVGDG